MRPLSHSSISMYLECPQKYKFKYIDKLPEKPKSFFSFGRSVHSALEYFYDVPVPPPPTLPQVLAHYKEHWVSEGYRDAQQEAEYFADGDRILRRFHAKHVEDFKPPFFAEYRFDLQVDGVPVTGFVDRIDRVGPDRIAIIDYKTGKAFSEDRVKTDAQLTMYQMACEELLGLKVESLTFYHLNSLTPHTAEPHSADQVLDLRRRVVSVAGSIEKALFEPRPEERKCSWCDYKPFCPVFRDTSRDGMSAASVDAAVAAPFEMGADEELATLVDRYGRLMEQVSTLQTEGQRLSEEIAARLKDRGWFRAFGYSHEVALSVEEKWEFQDKAKVLDVIRKAGLWDDILAPSAPLVQKLMQDPSLSAGVRERLAKLGKKVERPALRLNKIEPEAVPSS